MNTPALLKEYPTQTSDSTDIITFKITNQAKLASMSLPSPILHGVKGIVHDFDGGSITGLIVSDYGDFPVQGDDVVMEPPILRRGQLVTFDVCDGSDGVRAVNVVVTLPEHKRRTSAIIVREFIMDKSPTTARRQSTSALNISTFSDCREFEENLIAVESSQGSEEQRHDISVGESSSNPTVPPTRRVTPQLEAHRIIGKSSQRKSPSKAGFDIDRFESEVPNEFICPICCGVLNNPVQTKCDHLFCQRCIEKWVGNQEVCPMDREPLNSESIRRAPPYLRSLLGKLRLHCIYVQRGCEDVSTLDDVKIHEKTCQYRKKKSKLRYRLLSVSSLIHGYCGRRTSETKVESTETSSPGSVLTESLIPQIVDLHFQAS